jgi:hypothetical protein
MILSDESLQIRKMHKMAISAELSLEQNQLGLNRLTDYVML